MTFDFKNPNYASVFAQRTERIRRMRNDPSMLPALREYYRSDPAQFIDDFGITSDPRNIERGLPALIPFRLFPRQREWVEWALDHWKRQKPGVTEKSRDIGASWLSMAFACTMCLFNRGMVIGFGSRKEMYVDLAGSPKALFHRARQFLQFLPVEFLDGWEIGKHAPHMRIMFPGTDSVITGEAGDNIGRGDRASIYFVDEAAFLERPQLVEASLSQTSNCRLDLSTPNGLANPFAEKRFGGKIDVFTFHWRDDPRKDDAWYAKQQENLDPITIAAEIDLNYSASVEGVLIPSPWVQAAIGAKDKLQIAPSGLKYAALDVADTGIDSNGLTRRDGVLLTHAQTFSGKGSDIFETVQRAINFADDTGCSQLIYDSDGIGAGARGDGRRINEDRVSAGKPGMPMVAYRGSASVVKPEGQMIPGRKNVDFFQNMKSQSWWALRMRFQTTYRAVMEGAEYDPDEIICIDPRIPELSKLSGQLSQVTYEVNAVGKIVIDKRPDGVKSPDLADSVVMLFSPANQSIMRINPNVLMGI